MKYTPIDCNFYDTLEANAVLKKIVIIEYMDDSGTVQTTEQRIVDLFVKNKIEFMKLENSLEIRLDYLKSVDGKVLNGFCGV
jgi:Rho-binding antiterminator